MNGVYSGLAVASGLLAVAAASVPAAPDLAGWEKLGATAVSLILMWYFLQREVRERDRLTKRAEEVQDRIVKVLDANAAAMQQNAEANAAVADAIRQTRRA